MCGRFALTLPPEAMASLFEIPPGTNLPARYNIAPSQEIAVIRRDGQNNRKLELRQWGLIPHWMKEEPSNKPINARLETVLEKPFFRDAIRSGRCLVPADSYYEWAAGDGPKQPYRIKLKDDSGFGFAGICERWTSAQGEVIETAAILTMDAGGFIRKIHHRMPVILKPDFFDDWLGDTSPGDAVNNIEILPASAFEAIPVSRHVNSPRNDDPACFEKIDGGAVIDAD